MVTVTLADYFCRPGRGSLFPRILGAGVRLRESGYGRTKAIIHSRDVPAETYISLKTWICIDFVAYDFKQWRIRKDAIRVSVKEHPDI
jgi:hypothetical protein